MEYSREVKPWPTKYYGRVLIVAPLKESEKLGYPDCFLCTGYSTHRVTLLDGRIERICDAHTLGLKDVSKEAMYNDRGYEKYKCFRGD